MLGKKSNTPRKQIEVKVAMTYFKNFTLSSRLGIFPKRGKFSTSNIFGQNVMCLTGKKNLKTRRNGKNSCYKLNADQGIALDNQET